MPALRLWGRRWHIASDDLPMPAAFGLVFHISWTVVAAAAAVTVSRNHSDCSVLAAVVICFIALHGLAVVLHASIFVQGLKGTVLDAQLRKPVGPVMHCLLALYAGQAGICIWGTAVAYGSSDHSCPGAPDATRAATAAVLFGSWAGVACVALSGLVLFNTLPHHHLQDSWVSRVKCCIYVGCCGLRKKMYAARPSSVVQGMLSMSPMHQLAHTLSNLFGHEDLVWSDYVAGLLLLGIYQRMLRGAQRTTTALMHTCSADARSSGQDSSATSSGAAGGTQGLTSREQVAAVERITACLQATPWHNAPNTAQCCHLHCDYRGDDDQQQQQQQPFISAAPVSHQQQGPAPPAAATAPAAAPAAPVPVVPATAVDVAAAAAAADNCGDDGLPPDLLESALRYHAHATAVYGWPMYMWASRRQVSKCCTLCFGNGCGCCTHTSRHSPRSLCGPLRLDVLRRLTQQAILQTADIAQSDLVTISDANECEGLLPYYVALDHSRREVVMSIRGSFSVADLVTDVAWQPVEMRELGRGGGVMEAPAATQEVRPLLCHEGTYRCAQALCAHMLGDPQLGALLQEVAAAPGDACSSSSSSSGAGTGPGRPVMQRGFGCAGYQLVITGHSLGGGVAAALGLLLRSRVPNLRVWAFAPPGGVFSPAAAAETRQFCVSVIHAKDLVPRLTLPNLRRLLDTMMALLALCKVSKPMLVWRTLVAWAWPDGGASASGRKGGKGSAGSSGSNDGGSRGRGGWTPGELFHGSWEEVPATAREACAAYHSSVQAQCASLGPAYAAAAELLPPGRLLYLADRKLPAVAAAAGARATLPTPMQQPQSAAAHGGKSAAAGAVHQPYTPPEPVVDHHTITLTAQATSAAHATTSSLLAGAGAAAQEHGVMHEQAAEPQGLAALIQPPSCRPKRSYTAAWSTYAAINAHGLLASRNMFWDHHPDKQMRTLTRMVQGMHQHEQQQQQQQHSGSPPAPALRHHHQHVMGGAGGQQQPPQQQQQLAPAIQSLPQQQQQQQHVVCSARAGSSHEGLQQQGLQSGDLGQQQASGAPGQPGSVQGWACARTFENPVWGCE